ncbi:6-phospho-3-hexuloisomerase [Alicyclobacillus sendaiensis]|uniref:6-phospho-3-hexuloisomerase n=1 Tax=Alicyclobacillus sendaiensis TaxID=192387 RepID=UPI001FDF0C4F|nr:6-phospho-3-hexuloisomerase [Alicyclobacillus sendaiensis]
MSEMKSSIPIQRILSELNQSLESVTNDQLESMVSLILQGNKIYVAGVGRSGLMSRAFAMRLMHLGLRSYVVGDVTTPAFEPGDILIVGSGSGETMGLVTMVTKARDIQGTIGLITTKRDSTLAKMADITLVIQAGSKEMDKADRYSIQPMGSLFEQALLMVYDAIVLCLMEKLRVDTEQMFLRHANLE